MADTPPPPPVPAAPRGSGGPPPPPPAPADGGEPRAGAPVRSRLPARVTGLSCPSCGGALEVDTGVRVVPCPYCDTPLLALSELGVRRFAVEPAVDLDWAREAARTWLASGWNKHRKLRTEAEMGEGYVCFLPFFRVEADVVAVALGTEERERTEGSGKNRRTVRYEVDVERWRERHFDRTFAAVNVAELGVQRVDLAGDRLVPFDGAALERRGMVFPPTRSEPEVREAALGSFREEADPGRGLKRVRFRYVETVQERFTVVYYPLWVLRYRFRERSYTTVVDAEDGSLAYGKAPGNDLYRAGVLVTTEAAICFAVTTLLQWTHDPYFVAPVALVGLLGLGWAWRRFRYGGVVEEGSGRAEERAVFGGVSDLARSVGVGRRR